MAHLDDPVSGLIDDLHRRWRAAANPEAAPAMAAYMKSAMPFHGIAAPVRRRLERDAFTAHPLTEDDWARAVRDLWTGAEFREERYAAIGLARWRGHRRAASEPAMLPAYRQMVVEGAWWDYVDEIAHHVVGPVLATHPAQVTGLIQDWSTADDLWVRRTAILSQLDRKESTDLDLFDRVLSANVESSEFGREFFIRKAVGWALRQYARTDPDWVRSWVDEHAADLSGLSRREALKHL